MKIQRPVFLGSKFVDSKFGGARIVDTYTGGLEELFYIENPQYRKDGPEGKIKFAHYLLASKKPECVWIYFPWNNTAICSLPEDLYFKLRTARNRNLITEDEQNKYRRIKVGIAGLSVGSGILHALTVSGGPKNIKIADFDVIEINNLNRINAQLTDVGSNKTHVAAREVWELDPFADIEIWDKGISETNLQEFFLDYPWLGIFIDEMDDIFLKFEARRFCKVQGIPVIMATDNGDTVIVDVERFDRETDRPIFHGLVEGLDLSSIKTDRRKWLRVSSQIVDPKFMTERLQSSVLEISRGELAGVPQLGPTAQMAGAAVSFIVRRIANGYNMPSGRYVISLEDKFIPGYVSKESVEKRQESTRIFEKKLFEE